MSTDTANQLWQQKREGAINIGLTWVEGLNEVQKVVKFETGTKAAPKSESGEKR